MLFGPKKIKSVRFPNNVFQYSLEKRMSVQPYSGSTASEDEILSMFVYTIEELLDGLHGTFPECPKVAEKLRKFHAFVKSKDIEEEVDPETGRILQAAEKGQIKLLGAKKLIKDWHQQLKPFYDHCRNQDMDFLLQSNLGIIEELDIASKWTDPTFDQYSRDSLFQHINTLNMYAGMQVIPQGIMNRIQNVVKDLTRDGKEPDLSSINTWAIGKSILDGISEDELMEFAANMGDIQQFAQMASSQLGQPSMFTTMTTMFSTGSGGGVPDMGQLMKMLGGVMNMGGGKPPQ